MIIDIDNRQTGKTTRLINDVVNYVTTNKKATVFIVVADHGSSVHIYDKLKQKLVIKIKELTEDHIKLRNGSVIYIAVFGDNSDKWRGLTIDKWYYDEVGFFDENPSIFYSKSGYYCTSPKSEKLEDANETLKKLADQIFLPIDNAEEEINYKFPPKWIDWLFERVVHLLPKHLILLICAKVFVHAYFKLKNKRIGTITLREALKCWAEK